MPKTLTAMLATGLVLVTACGDDADETSAFCDSLGEVNEDYDRDASVDALREELEELEPPEAIAREWNIVVDTWGADFEREAADLEEDDLEGAEELRRRTEEFNDALRDVVGYVRSECDLEVRFD